MKFIEQLPFFYYEDENVNSIQEALEKEYNISQSKFEDTKKQLHVDTATWSLPLWEKMLGIMPKTEDITIRRKNIKAKLKARGIVTKQRLISITESYTNSDADLDEFPSEYYFVITMLLGSLSEEEFLELRDIIETIKPCHLGTIYRWMLKELYNLGIVSVSFDKEVVTVYPLGHSDIFVLGSGGNAIITHMKEVIKTNGN